MSNLLLHSYLNFPVLSICSCNKTQIRYSKFYGCAETDCQNKWNQSSSEESDNDDSKDGSDSNDECQYESSDEEWKQFDWKTSVWNNFLF